MISEDDRTLVRLRLAQARESLRDAHVLLDGGG